MYFSSERRPPKYTIVHASDKREVGMIHESREDAPSLPRLSIIMPKIKCPRVADVLQRDRGKVCKMEQVRKVEMKVYSALGNQFFLPRRFISRLAPCG